MEYKPHSKSTDIADDAYQAGIAPSKSDVVSRPGGPASIHRLPPEVLRMVLVPVVLTKAWPYFKACIMLGSVCRRWRELLNKEKSLWNDISITRHKKGSDETYPGPELFDIILRRTTGSDMKILVECHLNNYKWIFKAVKDLSSNIIDLCLSVIGDIIPSDLNETISQISLPALKALRVSLYQKPDSPEMRSLLDQSLNIALRSRKADHLHLSIHCHCDTIISVITRHEAVLRARKLSLGTYLNSRLSLASLVQPIFLPNLHHLEADSVNHVVNHLTVPNLRVLSTGYSGVTRYSQLSSLKPLASQLEKLKLWSHANFPLLEGCSTPLVNLKELFLRRILPLGSGPSLLQTPNLECLDLYHPPWSGEPKAFHCLDYMLSPTGMLGPIRALTQLRLACIPLSDDSQAEYCTTHLRYHPHLENLTLEGCDLPQDFLQLMIKPLDASNNFLPNLTRLHLSRLEPNASLPEGWFTELSRVRPSLVVGYEGNFEFPRPKLDISQEIKS